MHATHRYFGGYEGGYINQNRVASPQVGSLPDASTHVNALPLRTFEKHFAVFTQSHNLLGSQLDKA